MNQVLLSPRAMSDLSDIWNYTLSSWGSKQAEKYVRELWVTMQAQVNDLSTSTDISNVRKVYSSGCPVGVVRVLC